jgi:type I restriction enzyme M protein
LLNSDTKRHIDAARDVLVGVAPNPTTQIDQITYALIYKFMDDMDQASVKAGGEASFFVGELEKYSWSNLMSTRIGNQEKTDLYSEAITKFSEAKQLPELFRTIFRAAFLPYRSPETLGLFLKEISYFDYTHPEELGNAYEYLLSIMSSQGDAGQFRTPRHIIDFIVDVINPTKDDKVLDPACGTGGFLVSTYNHILEQHDGKDDPTKREKPLTPDERKKLMSNLQGYDIDPTMVRIAQVNMYLHQFKNPQIFQYDSLTSEERWNDKYDVILANPPFMSPKGGIKPHNKFGVASNRAEVLFVDYIINHLKPKGRAGIVVPEGVIFQSGKAYKELRKNLVENGLLAVVSLPGGVFQPYSGVKTSILFFDNELAKQKSEIAFVKISADGFDLGASKRVVSNNDLPNALNSLQSWASGKNIEAEIVTLVSKEEIATKGDYNLSGERYKKAIDYSQSTWPIVKLGDVLSLEYGKPLKQEERNPGPFPVFGSNGKVGVHDAYIVEGPAIVVGRKGSAGAVTWSDSNCFPIDTTFYVSLIDAKSTSLRFSYYLLGELKLDEVNTQSGIPGLNRNDAYEIEIPLPPLKVQEQIVAELDGYAAIVSGAKQIVDNWRPKIDVDPDWDKSTIDEMCVVNPKKSEIKNINSEMSVSFVPMSDINENDIYFAPLESKKLSEVGSGYTYFAENDVLLAKVTPCFENGKLGIARNLENGIGFGSSEFIVIRTGHKLLPEILASYLMEPAFKMNGKMKMTGTGGLQRVPVDFVRNFEFSVPPMEIQVKIVEKIEEEKRQVEAARQLIQTYEKRIQLAISKLWS